MDPTSTPSTSKRPCRSASHESKLQRRRERERARRASETAAEKEARLRKRRMRDRARRAAETEEQRQTRLQQKRSRESERLAAESEQHRLARLERVHIHTRQALDTETPEQRDARLDRMSVRQSERLATETPEERQARLSHVIACRNERLTEETLDQREARLQADRERHRDQVTHLPLLEQSSVQSKMLKFHAHCAALEMPTCTTYCKQFPGLKVNSHSGECLSCSRDKHVPKLYSSENNMNPGPVPQQLQVNMLSSKYYSIMSMSEQLDFMHILHIHCYLQFSLLL